MGPRVSEGRLHEKTLRAGRDVTILCVAQAYPVPHFRYVVRSQHSGNTPANSLYRAHEHYAAQDHEQGHRVQGRGRGQERRPALPRAGVPRAVLQVTYSPFPLTTPREVGLGLQVSEVGMNLPSRCPSGVLSRDGRWLRGLASSRATIRSAQAPTDMTLYHRLVRGVFAEPTGSVPPRVASKSIDVKGVAVGETFVGLCLGQGFPVPFYR